MDLENPTVPTEPDSSTPTTVSVALLLYRALLYDIVGVGHDADLAYSTVHHRSRAEGFSFFSKTLPSLYKSILVSLESGTKQISTSFKFNRRTKLPYFLGGLLEKVFDPNIGEVQRGICLSKLSSLCMFFYKAGHSEFLNPLNQTAVKRSNEKFLKIEEEVASLSLNYHPGSLGHKILDLAATMVGDISIDFGAFSPRHGPGSTSDVGPDFFKKWHHLKSYKDFALPLAYQDVLSKFLSPLDPRLSLSFTDCWNVVDPPLMEEAFKPARYSGVEKDSRGLRGITVEPCTLVYFQLGMNAVLKDLALRLSSGNIAFEDQDQNKTLARASSINRRFCTIDLKDASDRISLDLVEAVFQKQPDCLNVLKAIRSKDVRIGKKDYVLKKYAGMGNATTFPVQAIIFYALAVSACSIFSHTATTDIRRLIYVYGDDIIVPSEYSGVVCSCLETFGLKINRDKTFVRSFFRESCGVEAYYGVDVSPLRLRRLPILSLSENLSDALDVGNTEILLKTIGCSREAHLRGYQYLSSTLSSFVESVLGTLPLFGVEAAACTPFHTFSVSSPKPGQDPKSQWSYDYQRWEFLIPTIESTSLESSDVHLDYLLSLKDGNTKVNVLKPNEFHEGRRIKARKRSRTRCNVRNSAVVKYKYDPLYYVSKRRYETVNGVLRDAEDYITIVERNVRLGS